MTITIKAYAKINLTLKVLGKRTDGYHQVEMVMQNLALHDQLVFSAGMSGIRLTVEGDAPPGQDNLVYRAAKLLQKHSNCKKGAHIALIKNIPAAAGLAGGSADAATTLIGLNSLWGLGLNLKELMYLGGQLGADIPFCLLGGTALARGKGEQLTPLPVLPKMGVVLIKPFFEVSTAEVYGRFAQVVLGKRPDTAVMIAAIKSENTTAIVKNLANDLESVTFKIHPRLLEIKKQLKSAGALGVLMSGSGPTIYGLTSNLDSAGEIAKNLNVVEAEILVTTTL